MLKDNKNTQNKQNEYVLKLAQDRAQWQEGKDKLETIKDSLGLSSFSLDRFLDHQFVVGLVEEAKTDEQASAIIQLRDSYSELIRQQALLWPEDAVVEELNKKHAIIHIDQTHVLTEKKDALMGTVFTIESRASLKNYYEASMVIDSKGRAVSKADLWLKSPHRRQYDGIIFDPSKIGHHEKYYNIWRGFSKKAIQGDATKYWQHVRENICSNNVDYYWYVRRWLAYLFQYPDIKHTALVLCGSQGVGKNSFVEPLGALLGNHYVPLSSMDELTSRFNLHLQNAVLIHANEALWGGNKKELGLIKAMITEKYCLIEGKGKDRIKMQSSKHLIISSNEDWPIHIDRDDRRFFVLSVSEQHKEDHAYFKALQQQLAQGGYEALLYDLLHEDLMGFDPRIFPQSFAAFDIKLQSANSVDRYIYAALVDGSFELEKLKGNWLQDIIKQDLYDLYISWCSSNSESPVKNNVFGTTLKKLIPDVEDHRITMQCKRPYIYRFPSLKKARESFCKSFKVNVIDAFGEIDEIE
jgi:hypothetical protein